MRRKLIALAAVVALTASAAACASEEPAAPGAPVTVKMGFSAWPGWFPWQVAEEKGLFAENGVTVELTFFDDYLQSLTALATGALDANTQTLNDTLISVSGGDAQTIVLVNDNSTGNDQIIVREGIDSVDDLKGKSIAIEAGTVDHFLLLLALDDAGLTGADVELQALPTADAAAAFKAGQVDAVGAFAPFTTTALERPGSKVLVTSAAYPGAIPDHLVFASEFVAEHPDEVQKLVQTWFDTLAWIEANPDEALEILARRAGVSTADYQTYDAGTTIFSREDNLEAFTPGTTSKNLDFMAAEIADFLVETGLAEERPSLDGLLEPKFVQAATTS